MTENLESDQTNKCNLLHYKTLDIEAQLIFLDQTLRETLSVTNPQTEAAKKCLDDMAKITISGLMLKKNPFIVDAIRKCRKYKYDTEIQEKADKVFQKIKLLFLIPENKTWDTVFEEKVKEFEEVCEREGLSEESKIYLVRDPTHKEK